MSLATLIPLVERGDCDAVAAALRADPGLAHARTADGDTLLHFACWKKQVAIVMDIMGHGPDVAARGLYGRTPLHYAVHEGGPASIPVVAVLLAHGADPTIRDDNGFSVAEWAEVEMFAALDDVLTLLRAAPGRDVLDSSVPTAIPEPMRSETSFSVGRADRFASISVYPGRDHLTGKWRTTLRVDVVVQDASGAMTGSSFPPLGRDTLSKFASELDEVFARRSQRATLDVPEANGLRIEISAVLRGFRGRVRQRESIGPPGKAAEPLDVVVPLDEPSMRALVQQVHAACAALAA